MKPCHPTSPVFASLWPSSFRPNADPLVGRHTSAERRPRTTHVFSTLRFCALLCLFASNLFGQEPGQNVNMVSGTVWPFGDPFLERQDEPTLGVSTRNPLHLLAGANDYRTVDLNLPELDLGEGSLGTTSGRSGSTGEPWVGEYISTDGVRAGKAHCCLDIRRTHPRRE